MLMLDTDNPDWIQNIAVVQSLSYVQLFVTP